MQLGPSYNLRILLCSVHQILENFHSILNHSTAWKGLLKVTLFQSPCNVQGHLQLDQVVQSPIQSGFEPGVSHPHLLWATRSSVSPPSPSEEFVPTL